MKIWFWEQPGARPGGSKRAPPQDLLENVVFGCFFKAKRLNLEQLQKSCNLEQPGREPGTGPGGSKGVPHRICSKMLFLAVLLKQKG